ncbi:hypothetical protein SpCBS45565_g02074 [Spizellomyces sp. 'palustris']|nr:hypothetical protein SpCBS45565_g02074 [Spizellomyces sp. 'palustris']
METFPATFPSLYRLSQRETPLSPEALEDLQQVFRRADKGHKGWLSRDDFKVAMVGLLGYKPSKFEIERARNNVNFEKHEMTLERFISLRRNCSSADLDETIRQCFLTADIGCHGYISRSDLHSIFSQVAPSVPTHVIDDAFAVVDMDGDGKVGYRDFEKLMKYEC